MATSEDVQRLIVLLEARTAAFEKAMAKATATANRQAKAIETRFGKMSAGVQSNFALIGKGAGLLGISFAAQQVVSKFLEITNAADDLADASERLGIPIEKLQDLGELAQQSGLDFKTMAGGLDKFNANLVEAVTKGGDWAKTLELNGVTMKELAANLDDPIKVLDDVAEMIRLAGSEAEAETIAIMAFGRAAGPEMALALRKGKKGIEDAGKAVDKYGRLSPSQIQALAEANKKIEAFQKQLGYYTAIAAVEGINAIDKYVEHVKNSGDEIKSFVEDPTLRKALDMIFGKGGVFINVKTGEGVLDIARMIAPTDLERLEDTTTAIGEIEQKIRDLTAVTPAAIAAMDDLGKAVHEWELAKAIRELAELRSQLAQLQGIQLPASIMVPASPSTPTTRYRSLTSTTTTTTTTPPAPDEPVVVSPDSEFKKQLELLQAGGGSRYGPEVPQEFLDERATAGPDFDFAAGSTKAPVITLDTPVTPETADAIATTEETTRIYTETMADAEAAAKQQAEQIANVTENLTFERDQLHRTAREQEIYNALKQAGVDINSAAGQQIAELAGALYDEREALEIIIADMDFIRDSAKDFTETLITGMLDGADATDVLADAVKRLSSRLISTGIDQLFNALLGAPGTPGFLGAILGRATGGSIDPGKVYRVHKDELIVPRGPGTVIPAGMARRGEGGQSIHYAPSIVVQGNADRFTVAAIRETMARDMQNSLPIFLRNSYRNRAI